MRIEYLGGENSKLLENYILENVVKHAFTIPIIRGKCISCETYIAREGNRLAGYAYINWSEGRGVAEVYGSEEAVTSLVKRISLYRRITLYTDDSWRDLALRISRGRFRDYVLVYWMPRSTLNAPSKECMILDEGNAEDLADLLGISLYDAMRYIKTNKPVIGLYTDHRLVSTAATLVAEPEVWVLGGVFTRSNYRRRGYAAQVIKTWLKLAFREAERVVLWVRKSNIPARRLYEKLGFRFSHRLVEIFLD